MPGADHAYDMSDMGKAREIYALIADHIRRVIPVR